MCVLFGSAAPCVLVCWWFGGLVVVGGVCGVGVFGGCGVLCVGGAPLWCGVLVIWYVGVHVCVFLRGCCLMWFGGGGVLVVC